MWPLARKRVGGLLLSNTAVKILQDDDAGFKVGGYLVVFGGRDIVGDQFNPDTDFWLGRVKPPILYHHGQDTMLKRAVIGESIILRPDEIGLWIEAQINTAHQYREAIRELVKKGLLGWSSGAPGHLVERTPDRKIVSWPIVEASLTPAPCEPRTLGVREIKGLVDDVPALADFIPTTSEDAPDPAPTDQAKASDPPAPVANAKPATKKLSFEEIRDAIRRLLNPPSPLPYDHERYIYVAQTYPDFVIAHESTVTAERDWQIPYVVNDDNTVALGAAVQVEVSYTPIPTSTATPPTKAGRPMRQGTLDQLHTAMNHLSDIHSRVCDMSDGCPMQMPSHASALAPAITAKAVPPENEATPTPAVTTSTYDQDVEMHLAIMRLGIDATLARARHFQGV